MARRNRGGPKVVWLPQTNANSIDSLGTNVSTIQLVEHDLTGATLGLTITSVQPVIIDGETIDPLATTPQGLSDLENSGYRLRRIVGKIWCALETTANGAPGAVICTAGFIILRTEPVNSAPLAPFANYNAQDIRNGGDPWIWRRSWLLKNGSTTAGINPFVRNDGVGGSNYYVGGNADGPHVDQKTARLVGNEERLFLVTTTTNIAVGADQDSAIVNWAWDLRVLASMRNSVGNRRNASR